MAAQTRPSAGGQPLLEARNDPNAVASGQSSLIHIADAASHPLHLARPDWENGFDLAAGEAAATRRMLLDRAVAGNMHVMAFHFPFPSVGRVAARQEGGWVWTPGW